MTAAPPSETAILLLSCPDRKGLVPIEDRILVHGNNTVVFGAA